jgi:hypothetical protein
MSQPPPRAIVSHPIVLIVRTPLPTVQFPVCVLPLSVVIVTILVPDSLLSTPDYCSLRPIDMSDSCVLLLFSGLYCLLPSIVSTFLLFSYSSLFS